MTDYKPGDKVLVRAEVIDDSHPTDLLLEFFSKTDQWNGWVRTDLILPKGAIVLDLAQIDEDAATTWGEVVKYLRANGTLLTVSIADQIEAQTKPPRIPEPGLWAVVEAGVAGNPRRFRFGRTQPNAWVGTSTCWDWDELVDPVLIRPGIEDAQ